MLVVDDVPENQYALEKAAEVLKAGNEMLEYPLKELTGEFVAKRLNNSATLQKRASADMKTILLVEDYKNLRLLYQLELAREGYRVITASDGTEAINTVYEQTPDMIIIDFNLAKNCTLCNLLLSEYKKTHMIIHTTNSSYKDGCQLWPSSAFILKTSDLTGLKQKVAELYSQQA